MRLKLIGSTLLAAALFCGCGESAPQPDDKRWTLPEHEVKVLKDLLSGSVISRDETFWQYDDQDRLILRYSLWNGMRIDVDSSFVYTGNIQTYTTGQEEGPTFWIENTYDDSLKHILHTRITSMEDDSAPIEVEWRYDSLGRTIGMTSLEMEDGGRQERSEYVYTDKRRTYVSRSYTAGKLQVEERVDEQFEDKGWQRPIRVVSETLAEGEPPVVVTSEHKYNSRGDIVRWSLLRDDSTPQESALTEYVYSDYSYEKQKKSYKVTKIYDKVSTQEITVTTTYKY